ncbi:MAG: agmatinase [Candidatus Altiarchaeota archaeon]|nr:agmatinase [Candidatus Altiarchaeota archaeon]
MASTKNTFGCLDKAFTDYKTSYFAVLPIPYEQTTSYGKGTLSGPKALLEASHYLELYDEETDSNPAELGITTLPPLLLKKIGGETAEAIRAACSRLYSDNKFPIVLGGEHSISYGCALAAKDYHPTVSVLHFDAHSDRRDEYHGTRYSHGSVMARITEAIPAVSVGIRSVSDEESDEVKKLRKDKRLYFAKDILAGNRTKDILSMLSDKVYISFDVDVFDPSIMPSTGTPEPGGLGWYDILDILSAIFTYKDVVGLDVVELLPDGTRTSDFTAAKLVYKAMAYQARSKN